MATDDQETKTPEAQAEADAGEELQASPAMVRVGDEVDQGVTPTQLGATRYVMAGFLVSAIAVAYVAGRMVASLWGSIAGLEWVMETLPWLSSFDEDGRLTWGTMVGAVIAVGALIYAYRRPEIRTWLHEAANELAKVTWPTKQEVTSNTAVVLVASMIATVYFAILDRFWGFVTDLIYRV